MRSTSDGTWILLWYQATPNIFFYLIINLKNCRGIMEWYGIMEWCYLCLTPRELIIVISSFNENAL